MNIVPKPYKIEIKNGNSIIKTTKYYTDNNLADEEYIIEISDGIANIYANGGKGRLYADCTIEQLKASNQLIPNCKIHDKPKYEYRSFMIDCARHMFEIDEIKKIIDAMAMLKFNKFHWHLTDDQGWRFESTKYSQLNTKAAIRPFSNFGKSYDDKPYGRVYTKDEMKDVVAFCKERYIDVIPEFDVPGHTSAFLAAFGELSCLDEEVAIKTRQGIYKDVVCPANDKSYEVIQSIFDEFCEIFPYKYYHIGGDETPSAHWEACPKCKKLMSEQGITDYADYHNYFMNRIIDYLAAKGKTCIAWNDVAKGKGLNKSCVIQYWKERDKNSIDYINNGGKVVMSPFSYYYMDYDYDITSMKHTYSFNPEIKGLTNEGKANILGVEVPVWTEYIESNDRIEEMLFPRVTAVANAGWGYKYDSYNKFLEAIEPYNELIKKSDIKLMDEEKWSQPHITMVKGWLKFVFKNYSLEYIKSSLK